MLYFGFTVVGILIMYAIIFSSFDLPEEIFFQQVSNEFGASFATPIPYCIVLVGLIVEYFDDILCFLKLKKKNITPENEFKLNDFLTVRFEGKKSIIYVKNKPVTICKYLLMNIPTVEVNDYDSIDEASEFYSRQLEKEITPEQVGLTPEEEFKAHCFDTYSI